MHERHHIASSDQHSFLPGKPLLVRFYQPQMHSKKAASPVCDASLLGGGLGHVKSQRGKPTLSHNLIDCVRSGPKTYPQFRSRFRPMNHKVAFTIAPTMTVHCRSLRRLSLKLKLQTFRAGLLLLLCLASARSSSQTYAILHTFQNNGDGTFPTGTLLASGQTLYGVTLGGGIPNHGTVFKVNTDGSGYHILHSFQGGNDGSDPVYGLCLSGTTLYGITDGVNTSYADMGTTGTVFRINLDGTGYGVLTNFNGDEGVSITLYGTNLSGTTSVRGKLGGGLYGPASVLGNVGGGAIFKMNLDGTGLTVIRNFSAAEGAPTAVVALGNILYGDTVGDGESNNAGTVFKINPDGTGYSLLHSLAAPADGIWPNSGAILGGGALYGTTHLGGANNSGGGTLFTCDPNSTDYKVGVQYRFQWRRWVGVRPASFVRQHINRNSGRRELLSIVRQCIYGKHRWKRFYSAQNLLSRRRRLPYRRLNSVGYDTVWHDSTRWSSWPLWSPF